MSPEGRVLDGTASKGSPLSGYGTRTASRWKCLSTLTDKHRRLSADAHHPFIFQRQNSKESGRLLPTVVCLRVKVIHLVYEAFVSCMGGAVHITLEREAPRR